MPGPQTVCTCLRLVGQHGPTPRTHLHAICQLVAKMDRNPRDMQLLIAGSLVASRLSTFLNWNEMGVLSLMEWSARNLAFSSFLESPHLACEATSIAWLPHTKRPRSYSNEPYLCRSLRFLDWPNPATKLVHLTLSQTLWLTSPLNHVLRTKILKTPTFVSSSPTHQRDHCPLVSASPITVNEGRQQPHHPRSPSYVGQRFWDQKIQTVFKKAPKHSISFNHQTMLK